MRKLFGFTLAEVLITLGIIGIVVALTMPMLIAEYRNKAYVTQLHKTCNELQQGFRMLLADENTSDLVDAGLTNSTNMKNFLKTYFKLVDTCDNGINAPCFADDYKNINGVLFTPVNKNTWGGGACGITSSGASFCLDVPVWNSSTYADITTTSGNVFIDVNGLKGPNKIGRDAFYLVLFSDGVLDTGKATPACRKYGICQGGSINAARTQGTPCEASVGWTDYACFGKILNANWQMEY